MASRLYQAKLRKWCYSWTLLQVFLDVIPRSLTLVRIIGVSE